MMAINRWLLVCIFFIVIVVCFLLIRDADVSNLDYNDFTTNEVVFLMNAESVSSVLFATKALYLIKNEEFGEAQKAIADLVEINLEAIKSRESHSSQNTGDWLDFFMRYQ